MSYYFEVRLRGFAKDHLRTLSSTNTEEYHPHITFVRPFEVRNNETSIRAKVSDFCRGKTPIPFSLEGEGVFNDNFYHVPVTDAAELLRFDSNLEDVLRGNVKFKKKLNDEKILHATVATDKPIEPCTKIEQYMLRLTGIHDGRIWFSYDFVTQQELSRAESLDKARWKRTVDEFTKQYGLLPTRQGYKAVSEPQRL